MTPTGCVDNLHRLGQDPADIEAIVCSHGHFDHTVGLSGLIGRLGRANLPVLLHPEFWSRRRLAIPGGEPVELPTTSRRALDEAGFDIIEQRQPSFLYDRSVLIPGEVDRVTRSSEGLPSTRPGATAAGRPIRCHGRVPPQRAAVRADHRGHRHRARPARARRDRPRHCTGWKATHTIAGRLPASFIQNSVGTTFHLTAAPAA